MIRIKINNLKRKQYHFIRSWFSAPFWLGESIMNTIPKKAYISLDLIQIWVKADKNSKGRYEI